MAYVWVDRLEWVLSIDAVAPRQTAYLRWCPTASPRTQRSSAIESVGIDYQGYSLHSFVDIQFSPDSSRVAIAGARRFLVVNLQTGQKRLLNQPGEIVTSFAWLDHDRLGYAAHTNIRGRDPQLVDRTFWEQNVHEAITSRTAIVSEIGVETDPCYRDIRRVEHWSPKGRYVIYMSAAHRGRFRLLDTRNGRVSEFGQSGAYEVGVAWKADGGAAFAVSRIPGGMVKEALLVDPTTGKTWDVSRKFEVAFADIDPYIEPLWTADGQFIIVNDTIRGGCLVRPRPWQHISIVAQAEQHSGPDSPHWLASGWLHPLPITGWACWTLGGDNRRYAVDHTGRRFREFLKGDIGYPAWSADGTRVATVDRDKSITMYAAEEILPPP